MQYIDPTNTKMLRFDENNKIYLHLDDVNKDVYVSARTDATTAMINYMINEGTTGKAQEISDVLASAPIYNNGDENNEQ